LDKLYKTLAILLLGSSTLIGQNVSSKDSLKVTTAYKSLFAAIEASNTEALLNMSTEKIYCTMCIEPTGFSEMPFLFAKKEFIEKHLKAIKNSESYQRAVNGDKVIMVKENKSKKGIIVFWTIYEPNELTPGHEGGQLGIYFEKVNEEFKFAGIETIP
jgi:hypothetical protein